MEEGRLVLLQFGMPNLLLTPQWNTYPICGVDGGLMGESEAGEVDGGKIGFAM